MQDSQNRYCKLHKEAREFPTMFEIFFLGVKCKKEVPGQEAAEAAEKMSRRMARGLPNATNEASADVAMRLEKTGVDAACKDPR